MMNDKQLISKYGLQCASIDSDIIIPKELFLEAAKGFYDCGYVIREITWWEHRSLNSKSDISMGGPLDKNNSAFFWGETNVSRCFDGDDPERNFTEVRKYYLSFTETDAEAGKLTPAITVEKVK